MSTDDDQEDELPPSIYSAHQTDILLTLYYLTPPLSLLGSCTIMYVILRPKRSLERVNRTFVRLMLGYAVMDAVQTVLWLALGPWALPAENPYVPHATGSIATCNVKGFFMNLVFGLMLYSASLASYHCMKVVFEWPDFFITQGFEPAFHFLAWGWPIIMALPSIWYDNINPYGLLPGTCWFTGMDGVRGDEDKGFAVAFEFGFRTFVVSFAVTVLAFGMLWWKARQIEARLRRTSGGASVVTSLSRTTGRQGMRYSLTFFVCNIAWPFLVVANDQNDLDNADHFYFPLAVYSFLFTPLQGFVNAILFLESHRDVLRHDGPLDWLGQCLASIGAHTPLHMIKHRRRDRTTIESHTERGAESRIMATTDP